MPYDCGQDCFQLISALHTSTDIQTNTFSDALRLLTRYVAIYMRTVYKNIHPNQHILACPRTADKDFVQLISVLHTSTVIQTNTSNTSTSKTSGPEQSTIPRLAWNSRESQNYADFGRPRKANSKFFLIFLNYSVVLLDDYSELWIALWIIFELF